MLNIDVKKVEFFNPVNSTFTYSKPVSVRLEHSLISISKWEAIWEKAFLPTPGMTPGMSGQEEERSYIDCMIIGETRDYIPDILWQHYSSQIKNYIEKKHTATVIHRTAPAPPGRTIVTSELIYYWMLKFGIPFECQRWHLNRLLMLIDVCHVRESSNARGGKMSVKDSAEYMHKLNRARRGL